MEKLAADEQTARFLKDPAFVQKLEQLKNGGTGSAASMMSDPRLLQVMGVLMGINMNVMGGGDQGMFILRNISFSSHMPSILLGY